MRRYGPTLALVALAIALGLYLWLVDTPRQQEREAERARASRIVAAEEQDITRLDLTTTRGRLAIERRGETWRLVELLTSDFDHGTVRRVLTEETNIESI